MSMRFDECRSALEDPRGSQTHQNLRRYQQRREVGRDEKRMRLDEDEKKRLFRLDDSESGGAVWSPKYAMAQRCVRLSTVCGLVPVDCTKSLHSARTSWGALNWCHHHCISHGSTPLSSLLRPEKTRLIFDHPEKDSQSTVGSRTRKREWAIIRPDHHCLVEYGWLWINRLQGRPAPRRKCLESQGDPQQTGGCAVEVEGGPFWTARGQRPRALAERGSQLRRPCSTCPRTAGAFLSLVPVRCRPSPPMNCVLPVDVGSFESSGRTTSWACSSPLTGRAGPPS